MSDWKNVQYKDGKMRTSEGGGGGGSSTFAGLDDVSFDNIQNGQVPKYNSTTQKWENANESGGGGTVTDVQVDGTSVVNQQGVAEIPAIPSDLDDLSDILISSLQDKDELQYDATEQKWKNVSQKVVSPFVMELIDSASFTPSLSNQTNNLVKTHNIAKAGYYLVNFVDNYSRDNNRSYLTISGTNGELFIYNSNSASLTDTEYDYYGWSSFPRTIFVKTLKDNVNINFYLWGNGYSPSSCKTQIFKIIGYASNSSPIVYSNEEREVGVWTDGKPLYQKTVHISSLPSSTYTSVSYPHGISNIDIIANYFGVMRWANGQVSKEVRFAMFNSNIDNTYGSDMSIEVDKTDILISVGSDRSSMNADITIQYTKTTDTPGSGKWTTAGVVAHHYSTEEQIVGTWIDGKPLYQKTINMGTFQTTTSETLTQNIPSDCETIIKFEGFLTNTDDSRQRPLPFSDSTANNNIRVDRNESSIRVIGYGDWKNYSAYLTIQYTKTTD